MRVALLQIRLSPESVARNVQAIVGAIDRAANTNPPPDLLVLPGSLDTGGSVCAKEHTVAVLDGTKAAIVVKAREWGVFIAAGLGVIRDGDFHSTTVLFDPDGDALVKTGICKGNNQDDDGERLGLLSTSVGDMGLFDYNGTTRLGGTVEASDRGALMIVSLRGNHANGQHCSGKEDVKVTVCDLALRSGVYWCVVSPASLHGNGTTEAGLGSFVCGPSGKLLAEVDPSEEAIVQVDVAIAPADVPESDGRSGEHACAD